jgi:hypothetical protein
MKIEKLVFLTDVFYVKEHLFPILTNWLAWQNQKTLDPIEVKLHFTVVEVERVKFLG